MEIRNSTGARVSLLNSDVAAAYHSTNVHLAPLLSADTSSCASTPSLSPQTPQLVRSSSSDSRGFQTPSPLTPSYHAFDQQLPHAHKLQQQHSFYAYTFSHHVKMDEQNVSLYPPIPDATIAMPSAYPLPPQMTQQMLPQLPQPVQPVAYRSSNSPTSEPSRVSNVSSANSNAKAQPKKNQYPCPLAKQVGCNDFFTTSGHAARHAKKHTGKKDAFCPECNKAFTRKDNMEQHRRTHQNGRGGSRSATTNGGDASAKVKKPAKPATKKTAVKAEQQFEAAIEQQLAEAAAQEPMNGLPMATQPQGIAIPQPTMQQVLVDQAMMLPPSGPYYLGNTIDTGPVPALPMAMPDLNARPPLVRNNFTTSLEYVPPMAPMLSDPDALHYSYPSPGLSNGLNSLALAASEHRRLSEEKSMSGSPQESPSQETP